MLSCRARRVSQQTNKIKKQLIEGLRSFWRQVQICNRVQRRRADYGAVELAFPPPDNLPLSLLLQGAVSPTQSFKLGLLVLECCWTGCVLSLCALYTSDIATQLHCTSSIRVSFLVAHSNPGKSSMKERKEVCRRWGNIILQMLLFLVTGEMQ